MPAGPCLTPGPQHLPGILPLNSGTFRAGSGPISRLSHRLPLNAYNLLRVHTP
jgi:hypothetical protein